MYMQIASLVKHWIQATAKPHVRKKIVTNLHTNKHIFPYLVCCFVDHVHLVQNAAAKIGHITQ